MRVRFLRTTNTLELFAAAALARLDVGTGRKRLSIAQQNRNPRVVVFVEFPQNSRQRPHQIAIESVQFFRSVQPNGRHMTVDIVLDQLFHFCPDFQR